MYSICLTYFSRVGLSLSTKAGIATAPITPSLSAIAFICSSVKFLGLSQRDLAFEWEAITGKPVMSRTSQNPCSFMWLRSMIIPSSSHFPTTSAPKLVNPPLVLSKTPSPI
ncbi:110aa long hypothetical protein [Pyrococcus horikoshii OT3]|uniref:Uncharacterized protein n=1 Tax=Pyrococcus horikoshii (strain ATCC 700860 / DSM 12428 / JCM 9974 / NBRC 100139 / OT-3) TaxID=70601 RepID=O58771_PYRHO|nr:110aa long hypothetical protein [Pyrococcus horikoshii OT3]